MRRARSIKLLLEVNFPVFITCSRFTPFQWRKQCKICTMSCRETRSLLSKSLWCRFLLLTMGSTRDTKSRWDLHQGNLCATKVWTEEGYETPGRPPHFSFPNVPGRHKLTNTRRRWTPPEVFTYTLVLTHTLQSSGIRPPIAPHAITACHPPCRQPKRPLSRLSHYIVLMKAYCVGPDSPPSNFPCTGPRLAVPSPPVFVASSPPSRWDPWTVRNTAHHSQERWHLMISGS